MFTPRNTLNWRMTKLPPLDSPLNKVSIEIIYSGVHKEALPKRFPKNCAFVITPSTATPVFLILRIRPFLRTETRS